MEDLNLRSSSGIWIWSWCAGQGQVSSDPGQSGAREQKEERFEKQCRNRLWNWVIEWTPVVTQVIKNGACRRSRILADPELAWEGGGGVK